MSKQHSTTASASETDDGVDDEYVDQDRTRAVPARLVEDHDESHHTPDTGGDLDDILGPKDR